MSYVLLRSMKIKIDGPPGWELRPAGSLVPEAASWPNPGLWVKRGIIAPVDADTRVEYDRSKLQPMREATDEDFKRSHAEIPTLGKPLPGYQGLGNVQDPIESEEEASVQDDDSEEAVLTLPQLMDLKRKDLNTLAEAYGIENPKSLRKREDVADAIMTVHKSGETPDLE